MDMDLNVDHYTIEELTQLLDIKVMSRISIMQAVDAIVFKYEKNKELVQFFTQVQERLLQSLHEDPVSTTFQSDIKRGTINPDLKPTVTRFINIDSSCRTVISAHNLSSESFDFELTETLTNVVSMALYSVEIPNSWYNNTKTKGTASLMVSRTIIGEPTTIQKMDVTIPDGNYSTLGLPNQVATSIQAVTGMHTTVSVDPNTSIATFTFDTGNTTDIIQLVWFDDSFSNDELLHTRYNANLGWMLGFRFPITTCEREPGSTLCTATTISPVDSNGTKYILMSLNDYKTNRINRSLLSVNTFPTINIATPSYFNASTPQYRAGPDKGQIQVIESTPKLLTNKQMYTINSIAEKRSLNRRFVSHVGSDTFAKIPFKRYDWNKVDNGQTTLIDNAPSRLFVDTGGPLQLQMREYFGPVDLTQLSISLYDDKGHPLGLNGLDWSCTLMIKCIYQYS